MSSGFFIRSKRKLDNKKKNVKKGRFIKGNTEKVKKVVVDEEIPSSDEEILSNEELSDIEFNQNVEDEPITAQEKKLQLAKKYLEEVEREERERLEDSEFNNDIIGNRLKEDAASKAGKLKKKVADTLQSVSESNIYTMRNKDHKLSVTCVVISSDNKYIYSASKDCFIVKWDVLQKRKIKSISSAHKLKDKTMIGHTGAILCLAISHDNRFLVSGDVKHFIHVWNPETLTHIRMFQGHKGAITGLAICRDTNTLYSSSNDHYVKVWSLDESTYVETLYGHQSSVTSIDVLRKDRAVSCGGVDNSVRVWKIPEESQLIFNGRGWVIDSVKCIDNEHFVTCGEDGLVSIWGVSKKRPFHVIKNVHGLNVITNEPNWILSVASIPMTDVFATGSSDGCVRIWKVEENYTGVSLLFTIPVKGFINSMAFSNDYNYLVLGVGQEHKLARWSRIAEAKNSVVLVELKKETKTL